MYGRLQIKLSHDEQIFTPFVAWFYDIFWPGFGPWEGECMVGYK